MKLAFSLFSILLTSVTSFAQLPLELGTYSNGKPECTMQVSVGDPFSTGEDQLVIKLGETSIAPVGSYLTQSVGDIEQQMRNSAFIEMDSSQGDEFLISAMVFVGASNNIEEVHVLKLSSKVGVVRQPVFCPDLAIN